MNLFLARSGAKLQAIPGAPALQSEAPDADQRFASIQFLQRTGVEQLDPATQQALKHILLSRSSPGHPWT